MKNKSILLIIVTAALVAACSTSAPAAEAAPAEPAATEMQAAADSMAATEPAMVESTADRAAVDTTVVSQVSFSQDVWPIIEKYALAAHGGKGGVFLESYDDIMKYVTPGDPENSVLYKALIGDGVKQMPPDAPLPDEMIQTIYDWIAQGALNN
jgi:hypothetical protein